MRTAIRLPVYQFLTPWALSLQTGRLWRCRTGSDRSSALRTRGSLIGNFVIALFLLLVWIGSSSALLSWTHTRFLTYRHVGMPALLTLVAFFVAMNAARALLLRPNRPNVMIVLIDALRADHLSSYGYERSTSPNIDRFASDSVLFTQAISHSTYTKTSIASLFTGLYAHNHGVYYGNRTDRPGRVTSDDERAHPIVVGKHDRSCKHVHVIVDPEQTSDVGEVAR